MDLRITRVGTTILTANRKPFPIQQLATPHICADGSLALAYGVEDAVGEIQEVGDRIYAIRPYGSDAALQVMAYPPIPGKQCVDYLGAGAALARVNGGRYYALVSCGDAANNRAWIAWAWSDDGDYWWFYAADRLDKMTANPLHSTPVIYQTGMSPVGYEGGGPFIWHVAMTYNETGGCFRACIGFGASQNAAGILATWWTIQYSPSNFGLGTVTNDAGGGGELPIDDAWMLNAHWPDDAVDPMEVLYVNGKRLLFYCPVLDAFKSPTPIAYCLDGETPKLLDTTPVYKLWNSAPGNPSGNSLSVYQAEATRFKGYIAVTPDPVPESAAGPRQGLVEIELEMT